MTTLIAINPKRYYSIEYLPGICSYTDGVTTTAALLRQRRRWLNGGFSTTIYGLNRFCKEYKESMLKR